LGIADRVGSLEIGKDASFVVSVGDALDMRSSLITDAYIQGKKVNLSNKQKLLYEKYKEKFGLK
jgi:imidazolonepropionase-like amidohydrolase